MSQRFKGQGVVVIGGQWGDEGKGRIVDTLAEHCDIIVRFQGGNNAGHSLHINQTSVVLHLIPCGIMREGKVSVIGNGVVIDPEILFGEMSMLARHNIRCTSENLRIAYNAHIIFPFHKLIDATRENRLESHIGTTKRGIGPCYEDKVARFGIRARDLLSKDLLHKKLKTALNQRESVFSSTFFNFDELFFNALSYGEKLAPFLCDVGELLENAFAQKKRVLFEGAQGSLLDVDHGTYPFVTSSNCVAAQASIGSGIGAHFLSDVLLVSKAYCTRVGDGPFFTEGNDDEQAQFRNRGNEFGATTGRPRRCGFLDLVALKYAVRVNGATGLILTKVDILAGLKNVKVATAYEKDARKISFLDALDFHAHGISFDVKYVELDPVHEMPEHAEKISDLPQSIQQLCFLVEEELKIPIRLVSYGQKRGQELLINP